MRGWGSRRSPSVRGAAAAWDAAFLTLPGPTARQLGLPPTTRGHPGVASELRAALPGLPGATCPHLLSRDASETPYRTLCWWLPWDTE